MKICFTTALFGDPKTLDRPAKFERNPKYDYFLFTDIDEENFDTSWDVINIKDNPNISSLTSYVRKSRYPKFMSWELLESLGKHYDAVFYCDGYLVPNIDYDWVKSANDMIYHEKGKIGFAQAYHWDRNVFSGGVLSEMRAIVKSKRDTRQSMDETIKFFSMYDSSVNLKSGRYLMNTTFGYSFSDNDVRKLLSEFWKIYISENITYRDQPLWNFLILKYGYSPVIKNEFSKKMKQSFLQLGKFINTERNNYTKNENNRGL